MFLGLVPILWSTGAGAEVMKRITAPMVGGLATSFLMELIAYPVLYQRWKSRALPGVLPPRSEYLPNFNHSPQKGLSRRASLFLFVG